MSTHASFHDRVVLITGASAGVGLEAALAFHARGAHVVMVARRAQPLQAAAQGLERAMTLALDVSDAQATADALRQIEARYGRLDGLVNNAGAHARGPLMTRSPEELAQMVDVNLRAPVVLTRQALPLLRRAAPGAFIVHVASLAGKVPLDGAATYSATKFGLRAFSLAMAQELRGSGVSSSLVSPGPIDTGFLMDQLDEVEDIVFSQAMCSAQDVAQMILACALDGAPEREHPRLGGKLATLGYLWPALRLRLKPALAAKGRRVKDALRARRDARGR